VEADLVRQWKVFDIPIPEFVVWKEKKAFDGSIRTQSKKQRDSDWERISEVANQTLCLYAFVQHESEAEISKQDRKVKQGRKVDPVLVDCYT